MRFRTFSAVIILAVAAAGCGGDSSSDNFTRDDLVALLDVAPPMPGESSWMKDDGIDVYSLAEMRQILESSPPAAAAPFAIEVDALAEAGFQRQLAQRWVASGRSAVGRAALFRDEAAADQGLDALQGLVSYGWFFPQPVDDLGDEAVSSHAEPGAVYFWRRGNAVLAAWMFRDTGSAFDYDAAARAYADALDERVTAE